MGITKTGTRIYFLKDTREILLIKNDMVGVFTPLTIEEELETNFFLVQYNKDNIDCVELEYGEYGRLLEENKANTVNIHPTEKELIFSYVELEIEEETEEEIDPLEEEIKKLNQRLTVISEAVWEQLVF